MDITEGRIWGISYLDVQIHQSATITPEERDREAYCWLKRVKERLRSDAPRGSQSQGVDISA